MYDAAAIVRYSPRLDNGEIYVIGALDGSIGNYYKSVVEWLTGRKLGRILYGYHLTLVSGNQERPGKPLYYGEGAILKFDYDSKIYKYGRRWILPAYDTYGELGNFRESLGLTKQRKGINWHISIGFEK